jgi:hypothetical protein
MDAEPDRQRRLIGRHKVEARLCSMLGVRVDRLSRAFRDDPV